MLTDDTMANSTSPATLCTPTQPLLHCRTVWISDLHLGTPGCQAVAPLDFLKRVDCDKLYLVGDIIDGRRLWITHGDLFDGMLYCNDGDWVESLTALVEHADGRLEITDWSALRACVAPVGRAVGWAGASASGNAGWQRRHPKPVPRAAQGISKGRPDAGAGFFRSA